MTLGWRGRGSIRKVQLAIIVGVLALTLVPFPAHAVDEPADESLNSILLTPTSKRFTLKPGSERRDTVKILNDGNEAFNFTTYARPYSVNDELYEPDFTSQPKNADAYKWVQFDQPSYEIQPGQSIDVRFTIRVPESATPGGHYGVLFAETQPETQASGTSIIRKKRVGAILYVTVDGDIRTSGSFEGSDVPFFQFSPPLTIAQRIKNAGNTDFIVKSSVQVSGMLGGVKHASSKEQSVLPSTTRRIVNDWSNPAWIGLYKVEQTAVFLDNTKRSTNYVLLIPIWVYIVAGLLITGRILYAVVQSRKK